MSETITQSRFKRKHTGKESAIERRRKWRLNYFKSGGKWFPLYPRVGRDCPMLRTACFKYTQHVQLAPGDTIATRYVFRANSCFDPDQTGTGHQPFGWDQYTPFWNRYCVVKSMITVTWSVYGDTDSGFPAIQVGTFLDDDAVGPVLGRTAEESGRGKFTIMTTSAGGPAVLYRNMKLWFNAKNYFSVSDPLDNEALTASTSANPNQEAYFILYAQTANESTTITSNNVGAHVNIYYYVHFLEPDLEVGS